LADSAGRARGDQSNIPVPILRQALAGGSRHLRWTEARSGETVQYFLTPLQDTTAPPGASPSVLAPPAQGALLVALDLHPLEMLKTKTFRHLVAVNGAGFVLLVFLLWLLLTRTTTRPLTTFLRKVVETSGPSMTPGGLAGRRDLQETLTNLTKAVQDREAFHRAVLTSLPAQLAILDREGRILSVNPSWDTQARDMATPFPSPATVGSNYLTACRLAPPDYSEHAREALLGVQAVLDGSLRQFTMEFPCHAKAGERWYLLCATPLAQSSGGAVISYTDITERKQVEAALRESLAEAQLARERLDSLYKTAPIGMMYVTPDLKIERVNQFLADVHRRTGPEHLGRPLSDIIPPERWSVLAPVFEEVLG
ncbi:MAG: PAS domain-containing protein, partial [Nitrospirales bacterium]